jgi:FkbM family methyltransferase
MTGLNLNVQRLGQLIAVLGDVRALHAMFAWPQFSITSYAMVSALLRQGMAPRTVIDVGANVGQFSVAAAKLFPDVQVHSFEPLPECVGRLQGHARKLGNIDVYPLALGESPGEVRFHVNSHTQSSSILRLARAHREAFPGARETESLPIQLTTLDEVMKNTRIRPPCLLKLDVQGYETRVLRGATESLRRVDYVILEASFRPMYEGESLFMDIAGEMTDHGFRFARPVGWLNDPVTGEVLQTDALFIRQR